MEVDLHIHSNFSDGTSTLEEILKIAVSKNMKAISITDHDNVDVYNDLNKINVALRNKIEIVKGIEFSCNLGNSEVHILGYFLNLDDKKFIDRMEKLLSSRDERNKKIIELLNKNDIICSLDDIKKEVTGRILGRPHFANFLVKNNYCQNMEEAFSKYLSRGALAYVPKLNCSPEIIVEYLRENRAFVSLAHPKYISTNDVEILNLIKKLKDLGLNGLEANYSRFSKEEISKYKTWAKKYELLITGGSDFHGDNRKDIAIGQAGIEYEQLQKIREKYKNIGGK